MVITYNYRCIACGERFEYEYELSENGNCPMCDCEEIEDIEEEEEIK